MKKDETMCTYPLFSQNMQLGKEENKMWTIQLDEVNHKTDSRKVAQTTVSRLLSHSSTSV